MEFEQLYKSYWQKVFRLCMGYVNDYDIAQDIAQETFIIVWQKLHTFRNEAGIGTWIFRIASNNCLRQIEKGKRFPKSELPMKKKAIHLSHRFNFCTSALLNCQKSNVLLFH
jgi:RNA polymerase sigma-70 factor (ECF subfamily)